MVDALKNFAYSTVATAPSPATSGTTLTVQSGDGAKFSAAPFDLTLYPVGQLPLIGNAEIVRCTNVSTDTLTITRHQYGTTAQSVAVGWAVDNAVTANLLSQLLPLTGGAMTGAIAMGANKITGVANGSAAQDVAAFGQIPVPANGYGITGNTGSTPTPAVGLTIVSAAQSGNQNLTTSFANFCNISLPAGTYIIFAIVSVSTAAGVTGNTYFHALLGPTSNSGSGSYADELIDIPITTDANRGVLTMFIPLTLATTTTVYFEGLVGSTSNSPYTDGTKTNMMAIRIN